MAELGLGGGDRKSLGKTFQTIKALVSVESYKPSSGGGQAVPTDRLAPR